MQGSLTPPTAETPKYMTSREAARYVRLGRDRFNELVREGHIAHIALKAKKSTMRRYDRDHLDAFMAARAANIPPPVHTPATDPACDLDSEEKA